MESLQLANVPFELYTNVSVEPTDESWRDAIAWARKHNFSHFLACVQHNAYGRSFNWNLSPCSVGGGSVMDTAKAANLCVQSPTVNCICPLNRCTIRFTVYPEADLYDFVNAPVGKGLPISKTLRPLIAGAFILSTNFSDDRVTIGMCDDMTVPTTAGTGSETTGTAIVDIPSRRFKTGIASRALRPTLGIVDTDNTDSCPTEVHISAGLDVVSLPQEFSSFGFLFFFFFFFGFLWRRCDRFSCSMPWRVILLSRTTNELPVLRTLCSGQHIKARTPSRTCSLHGLCVKLSNSCLGSLRIETIRRRRHRCCDFSNRFRIDVAGILIMPFLASPQHSLVLVLEMAAFIYAMLRAILFVIMGCLTLLDCD